jgi:FkbM family methyltransferase
VSAAAGERRFRKFGRRAVKSALEIALPFAEHLSAFKTARGDYLPNRLKMLTGRYEAEEINLMRRFLRPGQTIVDVGANIGYLTRVFARATGTLGKVFAFEPNPLIFSLLQQNVAKFPAVAVFNVGLSMQPGEMPLFIPGRNHSVASFTREYPATHAFYQEDKEMNSVSAQLVAGDEFMNGIGIGKIDILKVDVEGWELRVLAGLEKTIAASRDLTLFCEYNPSAQQCAGRTRSELLEWLLDRQFDLSYPAHGKLQPLPRESLNHWIDSHEPAGFTTIFAKRS